MAGYPRKHHKTTTPGVNSWGGEKVDDEQRLQNHVDGLDADIRVRLDELTTEQLIGQMTQLNIDEVLEQVRSRKSVNL